MLLRALAGALGAGGSREDVVSRCGELLGREWKFLPGLVRRFQVRFGAVRPRREEVVRFLVADERFARAWERLGDRLVVARWLVEGGGMHPVAAAAGWEVRPIGTVAELGAWLHVPAEELAWFADLRGLSRVGQESGLQHYHYRLVRKRSGSLRLLEEPKPRLKTMQRKILGEILDRVPVHPAAHGFLAGRGIVSFGEPHTGQSVVLRMDLREFFPSVRGERVAAFFRTAGYPEGVADLLAGLCLNAAPATAYGRDRAMRELYGRRHLPQGAPTSPALTNVLCRRLDQRLTGLAGAAGGRYSRYADDLAFSGGEGFGRGALRFAAQVAAIVAEEGFAVNHRKTRVMRRGVRQGLCGLVVNDKVNVGRAEFDRLKAILTNCARLGPETQNRDRRADFRAHLVGRVSFVGSVNKARGEKLKGLMDGIAWPSTEV